jgi:hypothetical protein
VVPDDEARRDEELLHLVADAFNESLGEADALAALEASVPVAMERAPKAIRAYVEALELARRQLSEEVAHLRAQIEELELATDGAWYVAQVDAEVATFGDEAEEQVDWEFLSRERTRLRRFEAVVREVVALEEAHATGDLRAAREAAKATFARLREAAPLLGHRGAQG